MHIWWLLTLPLALALPAAAEAPPSLTALREGEIIGFDEVAKLAPYLPPEFWRHRELFFYEGMQLEIGPTDRDYSPAAEYRAVSAANRGRSSLGPEGNLVGHGIGLPFDEKIDCAADPQAGVKLAWNFDWRWQGDGAMAHYRYSYWDRGEELPLYYEGTAKTVMLAGRVESEYAVQGGDLFRGEKRKHAFGVAIDAPPDVRGLRLMTWRYKASESPRRTARYDDTWAYVPEQRRARRFSPPHRAHAVAGTDFTFDDLRSFAGIVPQYEWACLASDVRILAPMNARRAGYPYERGRSFGPTGLSFADDRWELRRAYRIQLTPKSAAHPYGRKEIYLDAQTFEPLYAFAFDRTGALWKILWHNHRWSGDEIPGTEPQPWYRPWPGVAEPRDLRAVADAIANVQTGSGTRIESWDDHGTPLEGKGKMARAIDIRPFPPD